MVKRETRFGADALHNIEDAIREYLASGGGSPINAYTLGGIVQDAGLTVEEFKRLVQREAPGAQTTVSPPRSHPRPVPDP